MPTQIESRQVTGNIPLVDIGGLRASIVTEIKAGLLDAVTVALQQAFANLTINVAAPQVDVAAPQTSVAAPAVNVDLSVLADEMRQVCAMVEQLCVVLCQPVTRDVARDGQGRIRSMTEKRG